MSKPKILFLDIESLPNITYAYNLYDYVKPDMIIQEKSILSFAYKFLGDKYTKVRSVLNYANSDEKSPYDDKELVEDICEIISEADYIVAHYGDKFDMRFIRARALINDVTPPAPVATIDTYKLAKKYFHLNANRLDYLGKLLGLGGKINTGWLLWQKCAEGDDASIKKMMEYNKRDVELLEAVFLKMQPHVETKINHALFTKSSGCTCSACGSHNLQRRGSLVNKVTKRQRWHCQDCGSWMTTKMEK